MNDAPDLPRDLAAAHALILAQRERLIEAEAGRAKAQATASVQDAFVLHLKLEIEKLRRALYGSRSERKARLLDQLEIQLEDAEADAAEDEQAAEHIAASIPVGAFARRRLSRRPFSAHLPRERVVIVAHKIERMPLEQDPRPAHYRASHDAL